MQYQNENLERYILTPKQKFWKVASKSEESSAFPMFISEELRLFDPELSQ